MKTKSLMLLSSRIVRWSIDSTEHFSANNDTNSGSCFSRNIRLVPQEVIHFHYLEKYFFRSKHPRNVWFYFENRSTGYKAPKNEAFANAFWNSNGSEVWWVGHATNQRFCFQILNQTFLGCFNPRNIAVFNQNKYFLAWSNRYVSWNKNTACDHVQITSHYNKPSTGQFLCSVVMQK